VPADLWRPCLSAQAIVPADLWRDGAMARWREIFPPRLDHRDHQAAQVPGTQGRSSVPLLSSDTNSRTIFSGML